MRLSLPQRLQRARFEPAGYGETGHPDPLSSYHAGVLAWPHLPARARDEHRLCGGLHAISVALQRGYHSATGESTGCAYWSALRKAICG